MTRQMKDSGVVWIGKMPENWKLTKLKNIIQFINGYAFNSEDLKTEGLYPVIRIGDISNGKIDLINANKVDLENDMLNNYIIQSKDTLIAMSGATVGKLGYCDYIDNKAYINQRVGIIRASNKFVYYYLGTEEFLKYILLLSVGSAQPNISTEGINNYYISLPPEDEQQKIVDFLDEKVGEIDNVIETTKATIEEYKKYKKSIITETVTYGLNPDVEMKDSGIEWIPKIPSHWKLEKGKHVLTLLNRPVLDSDDVITCFRDGEVTLRKNRREDGFTFSLKEIGYQGIEPDDLVIHGMDGFAGAIGISDSRGKASPVLNVCDSSQNKEYIMFYLRSMAYNDVFTALATGIRVRSCDLRWNKLAELYYPIPPLEEQKEIAEFIKNKCREINALISENEALLIELENYKKSLIYEYVTGKKEVE